ncbi:TniQ family protein [Aureimonas leprariae]|nr:TniQ family protein [Aureimonas leprariae]
MPHLWIRPESDEPVHGMMLRLAASNGLPRLRSFETMVGVRTHQVRLGDRLDALAKVLRCDVSDLQDRCYRRTSAKMRTFRGQTLGTVKDIHTRIRRVCPLCLSERPFHRFWWDFGFVATCPTHGRHLVSECSCGRPLSWDDVELHKCRMCEDGSVHRLTFDLADPDLVSLDRLLLSKFGVGNADAAPVLDELSPRDAFEVAGRVGALDALGYRTKWVEPEDCGEANAVRARGYRILVEGRLPEILDRVFAEFMVTRERTEEGKLPLPRIDNAYGWFVHWFRFRKDEDFSPTLARIIVANAEAKFRLTADNYPKTARSGGTINLSEAAAMARCRPRNLRRLLAKEGLIRPKIVKGSPVRIERSVAERIAHDLADAIGQADLSSLTGLGSECVKTLVRAGSLPCWLRGGGAEAHRFLFRRREVVEWMHRLIPEAPAVARAPDGSLTLARWPYERKISVKRMIDMLAHGDLAVHGLLNGKRDFASALTRAPG